MMSHIIVPIDDLFARLSDDKLFGSDDIIQSKIMSLDQINKMPISLEEKRRLKKERRQQLKDNRVVEKSHHEIPDYEMVETCKCGGEIAYEDELPVCIKCGTILEDNIDSSPEWRFYGADDNSGVDPSRCGMPTNNMLESTTVDCTIKYMPNMTYQMRKIRRYTEWLSIPYKEKSQIEEFQRISQMASIAGIPKIIIDDAIKYHKRVSEEKTFRSLNRDGIISASIYISCRLNGYPRTAKEIAQMFELDTTSAVKGCKNAVLIINKLENKEDEEKTELCQTTPTAFIERYCSKLELNQELTKVCLFIAMKIEKNNMLKDKSPHSIATGILYLVIKECNQPIDKKQLKEVSNISEVTINKVYKMLYEIKSELIPAVILKKYSI
jgi:transcription initiation factor TFIIB